MTRLRQYVSRSVTLQDGTGHHKDNTAKKRNALVNNHEKQTIFNPEI